eukprot:g1589.t1
MAIVARYFQGDAPVTAQTDTTGYTATCAWSLRHPAVTAAAQKWQQTFAQQHSLQVQRRTTRRPSTGSSFLADPYLPVPGAFRGSLAEEQAADRFFGPKSAQQFLPPPDDEAGDPAPPAPPDDIGQFKEGEYYVVLPSARNEKDGPDLFPLFGRPNGTAKLREVKSGGGATESAEKEMEKAKPENPNTNIVIPPSLDGKEDSSSPLLGENGCYVAEVEPIARVDWKNKLELNADKTQNLKMEHRAAAGKSNDVDIVNTAESYDLKEMRQNTIPQCDELAEFKNPEGHQNIPCFHILPPLKGAAETGFLPFRTRFADSFLQKTTENITGERVQIVFDPKRKFDFTLGSVIRARQHAADWTKQIEELKQEKAIHNMETQDLLHKAEKAKANAETEEMLAKAAVMNEEPGSIAEQTAQAAADSAEATANKAIEAAEEYEERYGDDVNMALGTSKNGEGPPMLVFVPVGEPIASGKFPAGRSGPKEFWPERVRKLDAVAPEAEEGVGGLGRGGGNKMNLLHATAMDKGSIGFF